ncbi:MAG TPA: 2-phospho-L-lactate guanylyltransferase [Anaerolineales bacterium]
MTIWAIVPVKPLRRGKSRLAGMLTEDQRTRLNRYLLEHVLTTLKDIPEIEHTLVVSRDPAALALTREMGGRTVLEDGAPQFNTAIKRATIVAKAQGAHAVLVLPADLPLINSSDLKALLNRGKKPPVIVIASDRRKDGTNGLFVNPAGLIEYGYGPGSFQRHSERAIEAGARLVVVDSRNISLDLDLPEDLEALGGLEKLGLV